MSRFKTVISHVALWAALVMIGLGITGMVTAKGAQAPECVTVEKVQGDFERVGANYKAFGGEETKVIYAALTEKYGPSPDGTPFALIVAVSPSSDSAVVVLFNEEGCAFRAGLGGPASLILPLITEALGRFAND